VVVPDKPLMMVGRVLQQVVSHGCLR
jgi:hypothetical protein